MTFEALEKEAAALPSGLRRRLIAMLVTLQSQEDDPDRLDRLADILDDPDPSRWLSEEEAAKKLGLAP